MGSTVYFCVLILFHILYLCKSTDYAFASNFFSELEPSKNVNRHLTDLKITVPVKSVYDTTELSDFMQISDVPEDCNNALEAFIENAMNFTRCAALNARPIRLCRTCNKELNSAQNAYEKFKSLPNPCHSTFFGSDQICLIDAIYNQAHELWNKSNCASCFNVNSIHLKDVTDDFFKASNELNICLENSNNFAGGSANDTCNMCKDLYGNVTDRYKKYLSSSNNYNVGICMDIVDKMNITRQIWHKEYNCTIFFDYAIGYANVLTAVLVGTMPVFFYLLAKNISIIEDVKIVRPKRKNYIPIPSS